MDTPTTRRDFLKAGAAGLACAVAGGAFAQEKGAPVDLILVNGRMATLDQRRPAASAVAIKGGRFLAVGDDKEVLTHRGDKTQIVDRSEEHTSELQSLRHLVCRLLLEKKKKNA